MYNLKKVIALVCVFALMLTTVAFGATYSDVAEDSAYYQAVETLNKLDIVTGYEDGTFKPEDGVTRAEMAALIARIQGYGETAKASANTGFKDVPASHWASGYIANAAGMGIINGYGDGNFGPEDPVLYEQAVKMVMATLGYTPYAEKNGGYPTGYLAAAQRYDVSLAVANAAVGSEANRGTVAQLLENALDTPLMIQSYWNTNGEVGYEIADGIDGRSYQTLMSANLGYVKVRGVVAENALMELGRDKDIDTDADATVTLVVTDTFKSVNEDFKWNSAGTYLGEDTFLVGSTDVADYIGQSVIIYVKKVADAYEVVSVAVDTNRNDELVINLDQFDAYDPVAGEIDYYKDGANTTTSVRVAGATAIFNNEGMTLDAAISNIVANRGGSITFIDNNDAPGYDVVIIKQAQTGVVDEVTAKAISFKNIAKINLNIDETKVVTILKDGEVIDASELVEWDILSVYWINRNSDYIVAEVVANEVVGTIASTKASLTSATSTAYKVGDAWYDVADGAYDEGMEINAGGKFYIDEFGKIAAFVEDAALAGGAAANYAYVNGIKVDDADFGGAGAYEVKVQLITADGVEIFKLRNNAKINDSSDSENTLAIDTWAGYVEAGAAGLADDTLTTGQAQLDVVETLESEVVKYVKNASGYITAITAVDYDNGVTAADFATGAIGGATTFDAENTRFIAAGGTGGYVAEDTLVFITDVDVANCKIGTLADLADENPYTILASYKDKKSDDVNIIVVGYTEVAAASATSSIAVVTESGDATNENGEAIWTLAYFQDGEIVEVETTADVVSNLGAAAQPTSGDIIKVKIGSDGLVTDITPVFDFGTPVRNVDIANFDGATDNNSPATGGTIAALGESYVSGHAIAFNKNTKLATIGTAEVKLTSAENIYVVDATGRKLYIDTASAGDFECHDDLYATGVVTVDIRDAEGNVIVVGYTDHDNDDANDDGFVDGTEDGTGDGTKVAATPKQAVTLENVAQATAQAYADHIYARFYDGKLIDVVIVKGAALTIER